jgi:hypothetical protein
MHGQTVAHATDRGRKRVSAMSRAPASTRRHHRAPTVPRSTWESARELGLRRLVHALREAASTGGAACHTARTHTHGAVRFPAAHARRGRHRTAQ